MFALPVLGAVALGAWLAVSWNDSAEEATAAAVHTGSNETRLLPLTAMQCQQAKSSAENGMETVRRALGPNPEAGEALRTWEEQYRETSAWIDAGCPADGKRGFIPDASGNGGQMILFPNSVSFDGSTHSSGSGTITLVPREKIGD